MGQESFVPIRTRPTVARDPPPEVYGGARDARKALSVFKIDSLGKGLRVGVVRWNPSF